MNSNEIMEAIEGAKAMKNKEIKLKTELTRNEVEDLLEVYRSMDSIVTDFREIFDTSINKISKLEDMSITLKNMFDFRPPTDSEGDPNHWRPYVLPDDDRAWYSKKEEE